MRMQRLFLGPLVALFFTVSCLAQPGFAADATKKPDDFRGVRWGAPSSSVPGLTAVDHDGDIVHYDRTGEKNTLGGIPLRHVTYSFYKGHFYHAEIAYEGEQAYGALQHSLELKYGPPDSVQQKTDAAGHAYTLATWSWPGFAFIGHRHDKNDPRGRIFYFYVPLIRESAKSQGLPANITTYTVRKGDTLTQLTHRFGISEAALLQANPDIKDKQIKVGATLAIPAKSPASAPAGKPTPTATAAPKAPSTSAGTMTTHTVKSGEVLSKIASHYGTRTQDIIAANPGLNPNALRPGTVLHIPSGSMSAKTPHKAPAKPAAPTAQKARTAPEATSAPAPQKAATTPPAQTPPAAKASEPATSAKPTETAPPAKPAETAPTAKPTETAPAAKDAPAPEKPSDKAAATPAATPTDKAPAATPAP